MKTILEGINSRLGDTEAKTGQVNRRLPAQQEYGRGRAKQK